MDSIIKSGQKDIEASVNAALMGIEVIVVVVLFFLSVEK